MTFSFDLFGPDEGGSDRGTGRRRHPCTGSTPDTVDEYCCSKPISNECGNQRGQGRTSTGSLSLHRQGVLVGEGTSGNKSQTSLSVSSPTGVPHLVIPRPRTPEEGGHTFRTGGRFWTTFTPDGRVGHPRRRTCHLPRRDTEDTPPLTDRDTPTILRTRGRSDTNEGEDGPRDCPGGLRGLGINVTEFSRATGTSMDRKVRPP